MGDVFDQTTGDVMITYRHSSEMNELFAALAQAQAEFTPAEKAGDNPHFKQKHTTVASILEATKAGRANHALSVIQIPTNGNGESISVTTLLGHSSGQWLESTLSVPPVKFDAQGVGSVITYLRRYALEAILCLGREDDDGEAAVTAPTGDGTRQRPQSGPNHPPNRSINPTTVKPNPDRERAKRIAENIRTHIDTARRSEDLLAGGLRTPDGKINHELETLFRNINATATWDKMCRAEDDRLTELKAEEEADDLGWEKDEVDELTR